MIKKFKTVSHVSTTADIWSSRQRSFLGVTCHWIDTDHLVRRSAALALRRFKGKHNYEKNSYNAE